MEIDLEVYFYLPNLTQKVVNYLSNLHFVRLNYYPHQFIIIGNVRVLSLYNVLSIFFIFKLLLHQIFILQFFLILGHPYLNCFLIIQLLLSKVH